MDCRVVGEVGDHGVSRGVGSEVSGLRIVSEVDDGVGLWSRVVKLVMKLVLGLT